MAIMRMKRFTLSALRSEKDELLKELIKCGCVEVSEIESAVRESAVSEVLKSEPSEMLKLRDALSTLSQGLAVLDRYLPEKKGMFDGKSEVSADALLDENGMWGSVKFAEQICERDARLRQIEAEISRNSSLIESLKPWKELSTRLDTQGTQYAAVRFCTVPARTSLDALANDLETVSEEGQLYCVSSDKTCHYLMLVCLKEKLPEMQEVLQRYNYSPASIAGMNGSARECIGRAETEISSLKIEKDQLTAAIESELVRRDDMKLSLDKLQAKISLAEATEKIYGTECSVYLEGWVPAENEQQLSQLLDGYDCAYDMRDPTEDEYPSVPVKLKNNALTDALNMVTDMYSLPAYGTVDPNPLMAPFFILFFGLMMADIGYGVLMVLAAVFALIKIKPEGSGLSTTRLLLWCGFATILGGVLTGGLFSDAPKQIYDILCAEKGIEPVWQGLPRLFSPTDDSTAVLVGSLILGWAHLNTGMAVSFVQKWKAGNKAGAWAEEGALWVLLLGGGVFALKKTGILPGIPDIIATGALVIGIAVLLIGAGHGAKGFGKVTAAFGCIYNTATGWFGDVLSYSRIMALMLAGGVIGQVFNTVAVMPMKMSGVTPVTVIAFVLIFLVGHAMNFGLNILGCYVHDLRLQCLEFFGKFYQDGGKPFRPLKLSGKYFKAKKQKV